MEFIKHTPPDVIRFGSLKNTLPLPLCQARVERLYKAGVITRDQYCQGKSNIASMLADKEEEERNGTNY